MNNYQSIATINAPEFINLQPLDINPMMSKCEIKVLYLGENRNGTSINKQAASDMAKTLRGAPIVGYYKENKQDFFDHGEQVIYDGEGVHFNNLTKPYGFVSPDAQVWFQEFEEFDESGESVVRTYLMTTGYLWTGQYKEAQQLFNEGGKPQSMELDENSLQGFWSKGENSDYEFFIINDAIFSKLCILGDDVEPCFEGSSITAPNISKNFTLDDNFKKTLFTMMKELQETLQGGKYTVADEIKKQSVDSSTVVEEETTIEVAEPQEGTTETPVTETPSSDNTETPGTEETNETPGETTETEGATDGGEAASEDAEGGESGGDGGSEDGDGGSGSTDYAKEEDKEEDKNDKEDSDEKKESDEKKDEDDKEKKYALVVEQLEELQKNYSALQEEHEKTVAELANFKAYALAAEDEKKDALIAEFYMLSDEDKKDVIDHKAEYSLDQIKSKLAVLCYDKKVSYVKEEETNPDMTVSINTYSADMPDWLQEVERRSSQQ